jgi:hypothetical protein
MHYANGQEAKLGDLVVLRKKPEYTQGAEVIGTLIQGTAGSGTCNGQLQPLAQRFFSELGVSVWLPAPAQYPTRVTISELLPIEFSEATAKA